MGDKALTAREGSLTRTMKSSFSDLCVKYDDIRNVDRLAAVQASAVVVLFGCFWWLCIGVFVLVIVLLCCRGA